MSIFRKTYLLFLIIIILYSCNWDGSTNSDRKINEQIFKRTYKLALSYEVSQSDSAIFYADSTIRLINTFIPGYNDSLIKLYEIKANAYSNKGMPDSVINVWESLRSFAINSNDTLLQANASLKIAYISLGQLNMFFAEKYIIETVKLFETQNDKFRLGQAYQLYGDFLIENEKYKQAKYYSLKAYDVFKSINHLENMGSVCINIGNILSVTGNRNDEIKYYNKAYRIAEQIHDTINLINVLNNIGLYYKKSNPDSTLYYYQKAVLLNKSGNYNSNVLSVKYNIARLYLLGNDFKNALEKFNEVLDISKKEHINKGIVMATVGISQVYKEEGDKKKSYEILKNAERLSDSLGDVSLKMQIIDDLYKYHKEEGNYKEAFILLSELKHHNDSVLSYEKQLTIHQLEKLLQTEKKEAENKRLNSEIENQKQLLNSKTFIIVLLIVIVLLSLFFAWKGYNLFRERSNAYNVLMKKYIDEKEPKDAIAEKEQTDSNNVISQQNEDEVESEPILEKLIYYYQTEKPYLNPKLKVEDVALTLNCTQKQISSSIKQNNDSNFNMFTNKFRVEEAKKLMENLNDSFYKIESIAYDSGFGSKSGFYIVFEQFTGVKPSYYRNYIISRQSNS